MIIDIYTSATNGSKYLSITKGTKLENVSLPATIDADVLSLSPFKTRLEIDTQKDHPALDPKDIEGQIAEKGYAIHGAKITLSAGSPTK